MSILDKAISEEETEKKDPDVCEMADSCKKRTNAQQRSCRRKDVRILQPAVFRHRKDKRPVLDKMVLSGNYRYSVSEGIGSLYTECDLVRILGLLFQKTLSDQVYRFEADGVSEPGAFALSFYAAPERRCGCLIPRYTYSRICRW